MTHASTTTDPATGGIDVGKDRLDLALAGVEGRWRLPNTEAGRAERAAMLICFGVRRVGLEASGDSG